MIEVSQKLLANTKAVSWSAKGFVALGLTVSILAIFVVKADGSYASDVPVQTTVTINTGVEDACSLQKYPDFNNGDRPEGRPRQHYLNSEVCLIRFADLDAQIPQKATVSSATLTLSTYNAPPDTAGEIFAYPVGKPWDEGEVTWLQASDELSWTGWGVSARGDDFSNELQDRAGVAEDGRIRLEITQAVQTWVAGTRQNNGLLLAPRNGFRLPYPDGQGSGSIFMSEGPENVRPELEVTYMEDDRPYVESIAVQHDSSWDINANSTSINYRGAWVYDMWDLGKTHVPDQGTALHILGTADDRIASFAAGIGPGIVDRAIERRASSTHCETYTTKFGKRVSSRIERNLCKENGSSESDPVSEKSPSEPSSSNNVSSPTPPGLEPPSALVSSRVLVLFGSKFSYGVDVTVGKTSASTKWVSSTHVLIKLPTTLKKGTHDVTVRNPDGGTAVLDDAVTLEQDPLDGPEDGVQISGISPRSVVRAAGGNLRITGKNFNDLTQVKIGDELQQDVSVRSSSMLEVAVRPYSRQGIQTVSVASPDASLSYRKDSIRINKWQDPGYVYTVDDFEQYRSNEELVGDDPNVADATPWMWYQGEGCDGTVSLATDEGDHGSQQSLAAEQGPIDTSPECVNDTQSIYVYYSLPRGQRIDGAVGTNRMKYSLKFPAGFEEGGGNYNWHVGTYAPNPDPETGNPDNPYEFQGRHWYHWLNRAGDGQWFDVVHTNWPQDERNDSYHESGSDPGVIGHYFDFMHRFYMRGTPRQQNIERPFTVYIDEVQFYYESDDIRVAVDDSEIGRRNGEEAVFPIEIENQSDVRRSFNLVLSTTRRTWQASTCFYKDINRDETLQDAERECMTGTTLDGRETEKGFVYTEVPEDPEVSKDRSTIAFTVDDADSLQAAGLELHVNVGPDDGVVTPAAYGND